jgi:hypothetical protein
MNMIEKKNATTGRGGTMIALRRTSSRRIAL